MEKIGETKQNIDFGGNKKEDKDGTKIMGIFKKYIQDRIFGTMVLAGHTVRKIEGEENIPEGKAIILPWHLTDHDISDTASVLHSRLKKEDVSIVSQSTNYDLHNGLDGKLFSLVGKDRFVPISNKLSDKPIQGSKFRYSLNPKDFREFVRLLENERKLIIAGVRPTQDGNLPKRAGVGGIISAYLSGASVIPTTFSGSRFSQTIKFSTKIQLEEITPEEKIALENWIKLEGQNAFSLPKTILKKALKDAEKVYQVYKREFEKNKRLDFNLN